MTGPERHTGDRTYPIELVDEILVRCPTCDRRARFRYTPEPRYRLTCAGCGRSKEWFRDASGGFGRPRSGPRLPRYDLEVWLQVPCCGQTLWAFNETHLELLESYTTATLRARNRHPEHGWANASVTSRLPKWLKAAKNRSEVMAGLSKLRALLDADS